MTDLVPIPDVQLTLTTWTPNSPMSFEEWEQAGHQLGVMGRACQWWIGDWVRYGEHAFGERYAQAIEQTGLDYGTLANYTYVAGRIEPSRRREDLSWSHHQEVAPLEDPAQRDEWLDRAAQEGLSREKLRAALRAQRDHPSPEPATGERFRTELIFEHHADSYEHATEQATRLADRLVKAGVRVTFKSTRPA